MPHYGILIAILLLSAFIVFLFQPISIRIMRERLFVLEIEYFVFKLTFSQKKNNKKKQRRRTLSASAALLLAINKIIPLFIKRLNIKVDELPTSENGYIFDLNADIKIYSIILLIPVFIYHLIIMRGRIKRLVG